ncbi:MAG: hypothetical protein ACLUNV_11105, partial [Sutterella wadsworthensis]
RLDQTRTGLAAAFEQSAYRKDMELRLLEERLPDMERRLDEAALHLRALGHALAGLDPDKPLAARLRKSRTCGRNGYCSRRNRDGGRTHALLR